MTLSVLHSYPIWLPRTQIWMYNQVRFHPPDIEPHVVCEKTENLDEFGIPNIHCLADRPAWRRALNHGLRTLRLHGSLGFAAATVRDHGIDLLHSHFGHIGWTDMPVARRARIGHVVTFYGMDVNFLPLRFPRWRRRYHDLFDQIDMVQCEGGHMAERVAALGCPEAKIRVQHLGAPLEDIAFVPRPWQPGEPLRILMAASFREKKGFPLALAAVAQLRDDLPIEITLVGDAGPDQRAQAEKRRILETIDRYQLRDTIKMPGYISHAQLLREAADHHLFLSPSITAADGDTEGGAPVSLIDMAASGLVIVSSTHCDIPEIVEQGITGYLAEEGDPESLLETLRLAINQADRWDKMRIASRHHVETKFGAREQSEKLAAIYRSVLQSRSSDPARRNMKSNPSAPPRSAAG